MRELERRHWDELVIDYSQLLFMLMGRAFHLLMEQAGGSNVLKEQKLEMQSKKVSLVGIPDRYESGLLKDYKSTSVWAVIRGASPEWIAQINIYAYLLQSCLNVHTSKCMAVAYLRDWSINKAKQGKSYPQCAMTIFDIPLWNSNETEGYIKERIEGHLNAQSLSDDKLPLCTDLEMWEHPTQYAVKKKGVKSARRVLDSESDAKSWINAAIEKGEPASSYSIEVRKGERPRCDNYCFARQFCSQYQGTES